MTTQEPPDVQSYTKLARDYDDIRYVGATNLLKEGFRRRAMRELFPPHAGRALDVACGTGRGVLILHEDASTVVGIDGTLEMLQIAHRKVGEAGYRARFAQANAGALPFASGTFDLVTCLNFVHLFTVEEKRAFAREIARVLKPGGVALIEFDNALEGVVLGALRKYFVKDIGYDWPWDIHSCFPRDLFSSTTTRGTNLPGVWRIPPLHFLEKIAGAFPLNYLSGRILVRAVRAR